MKKLLLFTTLCINFILSDFSYAAPIHIGNYIYKSSGDGMVESSVEANLDISDNNFIYSAAAHSSVGYELGKEYAKASASGSGIFTHGGQSVFSKAVSTLRYGMKFSYTDGIDHGPLKLNINYLLYASGQSATSTIVLNSSDNIYSDDVFANFGSKQSISKTISYSLFNWDTLYINLRSLAGAGAGAEYGLGPNGGSSYAYADPIISVAEDFEFSDLVTLSFFHIGMEPIELEYQSGEPLPSAVPIPASVWLFAPALLGLVGCRRKAA